MTRLLEYHSFVRRSIAATVAMFGLLLPPAFLVSASHAQINGVPASVTSPGFGGRAINGTPASVTSLGPRGFTQMFNPTAGVQFFSNIPQQNFNHDRHRRRHRDTNFFPVVGVYPVPVAVPYAAETEPYAEDDSDYQGGPTVFDRHGRGAESYIPPVRDVAPTRWRSTDPATPAATSEPPAPEPSQPTMLVFKDGHELEIGNYAIVGQTLFDLTAGHSRKIALADLDLESTLKKNEDRGVSFQLPPGAQAN